MEKTEIIEAFLQSLGDIRGKGFTIVCNGCGNKDDFIGIISNHAEKFDYSSSGVYGSEFTGHMWDDVTLKCKECGNTINADV